MSQFYGQTMYSPRQAADRCGVSDDTIRRRLAKDEIPGARRAGGNPRDPWLIPESGLVAAGLLEQGRTPERATRPEASELALARVELLERMVEHLEATVEFQQRVIDSLIIPARSRAA